VDNAIKYSPDDTIVTISIKKKDKYASIEVKNKGKGIDAGNLPFIFDRFYRVDSSRTGGTKSGYGLGLSLAKKIVEIHHGELSVSSAVDQETVFRILLPLFIPIQAKSQ
jgi:signal transduction histidine kinase